MSFIHKKTKKAENSTENVERKLAEKALRMLTEETYLRELYDYNLIEFIEKINSELEKRKEKRQTMINSVGDMYRFMTEHNETHSTFYYKRMSPKEMMNESYIDDVSDDGYSRINQQLGDTGKKSFPFGKNKALLVIAYPEDEESIFRYEVDIVEIG